MAVLKAPVVKGLKDHGKLHGVLLSEGSGLLTPAATFQGHLPFWKAHIPRPHGRTQGRSWGLVGRPAGCVYTLGSPLWEPKGADQARGGGRSPLSPCCHIPSQNLEVSRNSAFDSRFPDLYEDLCIKAGGENIFYSTVCWLDF